MGVPMSIPFGGFRNDPIVVPSGESRSAKEWVDIFEFVKEKLGRCAVLAPHVFSFLIEPDGKYTAPSPVNVCAGTKENVGAVVERHDG